VIRSVATALGLLLIVPGVCRGTIVEIALPELLGEYSVRVARATVVVLPSRPTKVHSVSFRLSGVSSRGIMCCNPGPWECYYTGLPLTARIPDEPSVYADVATPDTSGPYAWVGPFAVPAGTQWDSLLAGRASVSLEASSMTFPNCIVDPAPIVTVTGAVLVLDAEVQSNTWGRVKGLYR
jgi:hypothetical protein